MLRIAIFIICLGLLPHIALAGAWPREKGTAFVATSFAMIDMDSSGAQYEQGLYLEYGATERLTLGFAGTFNPNSSGEAQVFFRLPLNMGDRAAVMALEFGLGGHSSDAVTYNAYAKTGLSWGRGVELWEKSGWLALDTAFLWDIEGIGHRLKLDATLGLTLSQRIKVMGQAFVELTENSETLSLVPSVVWSTKSGRVSFVLGVEEKRGDGAQTALRFSLWSRF